MLSIDIPGFASLTLHFLVLDYNGTLALDGHLQPGVLSRLSQLKSTLTVHILTADTFGTVRATFAHTDYHVHVLPQGNEAQAKADYIAGLGASACACIGNGANDAIMLRTAGLSMAVLQAEGVARAALDAAHLVVPGIDHALDLLMHPHRLRATLRT